MFQFMALLLRFGQALPNLLAFLELRVKSSILLLKHIMFAGALATALISVGGCGKSNLRMAEADPDLNPDYLIGPGDSLNVFVWRQPELSASVIVRPDGKITTPLVEDVPAAGKTPTELARDVEEMLTVYVRDPVVTVMVSGFQGPFSQQVRVVGEAANPQAIAYRDNMTLLDVMIQVGGLTEFAAGNKASIVREVDGRTQQYGVRINDLVKRGDIRANVAVLPGDILIIPESWL
jgi:polysaccharide export outer membrane protein